MGCFYSLYCWYFLIFFLSLYFLVLSYFPQLTCIIFINRKKCNSGWSFNLSVSVSPRHPSMTPYVTGKVWLLTTTPPRKKLFLFNLHFHHIVYQESNGSDGSVNDFSSSDPLLWWQQWLVVLFGTGSNMAVPSLDCKQVWQERSRSKDRAAINAQRRWRGVPLGWSELATENYTWWPEDRAMSDSWCQRSFVQAVDEFMHLDNNTMAQHSAWHIGVTQ